MLLGATCTAPPTAQLVEHAVVGGHGVQQRVTQPLQPLEAVPARVEQRGGVLGPQPGAQTQRRGHVLDLARRDPAPDGAGRGCRGHTDSSARSAPPPERGRRGLPPTG
ncbi:hypothetical protein DQ240_16920 [Blastococcus sp. TF02A-26]|nr:hypothetical protein DQ240_16920 [Blastococcus sp. TF02A-26]